MPRGSSVFLAVFTLVLFVACADTSDMPSGPDNRTPSFDVGLGPATAAPTESTGIAAATLDYRPIAYNAYVRSDGMPLHINRVPPSSVEEAEAEGSLYRSGYTPEDIATPSPEVAWDTGGEAAECIPVEDRSSRVRSADWVLGPASRGEVGAVTLYPMNPGSLAPGSGARVPQLLLRAASVGTSRYHVVESWERASEGTERLLGYSLSLALPNAGEWIIVATAGPNWGCFVINASQSEVAAPIENVGRVEATGASHPRQAVQHSEHVAFSQEAEGVPGSPFGTDQRSCVEVNQIVQIGRAHV